MGRPVMVPAAAVSSSGENVASVTQALHGKVLYCPPVCQQGQATFCLESECCSWKARGVR